MFTLSLKSVSFSWCITFSMVTRALSSQMLVLYYVLCLVPLCSSFSLCFSEAWSHTVLALNSLYTQETHYILIVHSSLSLHSVLSSSCLSGVRQYSQLSSIVRPRPCSSCTAHHFATVPSCSHVFFNSSKTRESCHL